MIENRNSDLEYERMPLQEIEKLLRLFYKHFKYFLELNGFPDDIGFHISFYSLIDIIIRVDKRKAYYRCFHNMGINECKEVALYGYWILKLKPFTITDMAYKKIADACTINELFVIFLIGFVLEATGRIKNTPDLKDSYSKLMDYSF